MLKPRTGLSFSHYFLFVYYNNHFKASFSKAIPISQIWRDSVDSKLRDIVCRLGRLTYGFFDMKVHNGFILINILINLINYDLN